jgi:hypothetical protein
MRGVRRALALGVVLGLSGCAGALTGSTALITTAVALGSSAISRSQGGCYAACVNGTTCNHETGLCDPLPCRGQCAQNEACDQSGAVEKDVPAVTSELNIDSSIRLPPRERVTPR